MTLCRKCMRNLTTFLILNSVMIKIAWENKGTTHGLACHENVKTSSNRIGKTHTTTTTTHAHTRDTLSIVSLFLYLHCLHIAQLCLSRSLIPHPSHLFQGCLAAHGSFGSGSVLSVCHSFESSANNEVGKWQINVCVNEQCCH